MKTFTFECKFLYEGESWTRAEATYDADGIVSITDEFGKNHTLESLSPFDRAILDKHHVFNLLADDDQTRWHMIAALKRTDSQEWLSKLERHECDECGKVTLWETCSDCDEEVA